MKRFIAFIVALFLLIASEYFLLNEIFGQKRLPIMAVSLIMVVLCIFVFLRFFKSSVITSWKP